MLGRILSSKFLANKYVLFYIRFPISQLYIFKQQIFQRGISIRSKCIRFIKFGLLFSHDLNHITINIKKNKNKKSTICIFHN